MKLIADSGSTKTNWALLSDGEPKVFSTVGINLYYQSESEVLEILADVQQQFSVELSSIHFYGAGISNEEKAATMEQLLQTIAPKPCTIVAQSDLVGASTALFGNKKGLACILGTGTGTGLFNGKKIVEQVPSLGFWLGDEGSGADLGRRLLKAYLRKQMPQSLSNLFENKNGKFDRHHVFKIVKEDATPNRYFGSFALFISEHIEEPFLYKLVENAFEDFVSINLVNYANVDAFQIGFVGSVGFYFKAILVKVIAKHLDNEVVFLKDPLHNLIKYHQ